MSASTGRAARAALLATVFTSVCTAVPAFAQDSADTGVKTGGLEEIVVTARKRQESVQDVPVAVTALSAEMIQNRDVTSVEKIAAIAPGFNVGRASNGSGAQLTLRGIGSSSTSIGIEQSVAVVVDGAYYGQGRVINEGFFDLGRVEVLKGPQALFFGKNATAGVISITTADPGPEREFIARAGYEFKAKQYKLELIGSMPVSDTLGVRLAARYSKMEGGYYTNLAEPFEYTTRDIADILAGGDGNPMTSTASPAPRHEPGEEEFLGRATIKFQPTDNLTFTLKGNYDWNTVNNSSWNYVAYACGRADGLSQQTGQPCQRDFVTYQNNLPTDLAGNLPWSREDGSLYNRYESASGTLNSVYETDQLQITSVTNYQWVNNRWTCACDFQSTPTSVWATENSTWKAWSEELRFLSTFDGPLNFMIGGLYQKTTRDFNQQAAQANLYNSAAPSPELVYLGNQKFSQTKGETFAVFGQLTYKITPTLELAGGARYTAESKDSYFYQPYVNPGLSAVFRPATDPLGYVTANQNFDDISPEATLTWKPMPDLMIYGAYKTAYKSGGFSNGGINSKFSSDPKGDLTFDPETAEGFEIGIKSTILDNQLRLNLTAFTYDYKNLQVDFFNSPIFAFQTLTADSRSRGIEVEFQYAPHAVEGLDIHGSINYTDAYYTSFPEAPCYAGQTIAQGCVQISPIAARQNLTGASLSVSPDWTGNFGVGFTRYVGNDYRFGFNVDARYSDSYLVSGFGNPLSKQGSYVTLDAGVRFGAADDNWQIALIGKNLTNQFYVTGVVDGPFTGSGTGTASGVPADQLGFGNIPRTVQVELTKRF
ncbi:TonB-dependent receptor [Novosphingobium malaysiense]|uniref:Ligand-gated channel n=1 Tax=Novosphingobium malaysiense TaxID=1348853 RepID=A0A0B1ZR27_9SPHN|nr:TonB-dependent receptor [Novosphingobium malaysiense]KHK93051.1 ligand-gated channel [Novosphingobium malaysiense]